MRKNTAAQRQETETDNGFRYQHLEINLFHWQAMLNACSDACKVLHVLCGEFLTIQKVLPEPTNQ